VHGSRKQCKPLIENATTALENDGKKEKLAPQTLPLLCREGRLTLCQ